MADPETAPVIVWFRQDLRLADNPALDAAVRSGRPVIPVYVLDETEGVRSMGAASRWWLGRSLRALSDSLEPLGARLVLRRGPARTVIEGLAQSTAAAVVHWDRIYDRAGADRDTALERSLAGRGIKARTFNASLLNEPSDVKTRQGGPYKVFTAYWRQARQRIGALDPLTRPPALRPPRRWPRSELLESWGLQPQAPDWSSGFDWTPGEDGAHRRLDRFVDDALERYSAGRNFPGVEGTSRLSPHLHWGEMSPRQIWRRLELVRHARDVPDAEIEKFLAELGWRDFNHQLLFRHPDLAQANLDRRFDRFAWRNDVDGLEAWRRGRTGYPLVDAAMRQLWTTGWMHNRMRMVSASFLIKHLLIDWRLGEAWFWDTLVDADHANNAANWQWVAGSGADAQPFFRIFNPVTQGQRYDADGAYTRRWIPELGRLATKFIHAPWTADAAVLAAAGVELGTSYPQAIVAHAPARARALETFRALGGVDDPRSAAEAR